MKVHPDNKSVIDHHLTGRNYKEHFSTYGLGLIDPYGDEVGKAQVSMIGYGTSIVYRKISYFVRDSSTTLFNICTA